jgi:hypothetical protein
MWVYNPGCQPPTLGGVRQGDAARPGPWRDRRVAQRLAAAAAVPDPVTLALTYLGILPVSRNVREAIVMVSRWPRHCERRRTRPKMGAGEAYMRRMSLWTSDHAQARRSALRSGRGHSRVTQQTCCTARTPSLKAPEAPPSPRPRLPVTLTVRRRSHHHARGQSGRLVDALAPDQRLFRAVP